MRILAIALCVTLAGPALGQTALAEVAAQTALPGWLAGAWEQKDGETWADEFWSPPRTGIMMGAARIGKATVLATWEHTRILRKPDGSLSFYAQPSGVPASEFPMVTQGPQMIEFANPRMITRSASAIGARAGCYWPRFQGWTAAVRIAGAMPR